LKVLSARVEEEMDVRVDKAGKKSGVAEVNDFGSEGTRYFRADFDYSVARDQYLAGGCDVAGFYVKQARRVEDDCLRTWGKSGLC
jgi:hypothetical protein